MSTFSVNWKALDGLSPVLFQRWLDLRAGGGYAADNTWLAHGGGQFGLLLPQHQLVIDAVEKFFEDAADQYAAPIAGRVDAAVQLYRTTDQRAADRLLPTWSPLVPPVDAPPPGPKAGPEIFADVVDPTDPLVPPGRHDGDMPYQPSWTDLLSPTSTLRDALYVASVVAARFGWLPRPVDPFEDLLVPFVGDWPGLLRCAEVWDRLAAELDAIGLDLTHEERMVPRAWTGNAADGLRYCLVRFAGGAETGAGDLRTLAAAYRELAAGVYRNSQLVGNLLTMAADWQLGFGEGDLAAMLEVPTQVMDLIQVLQQALPLAADAIELIRHGLRDDIIRRFGVFAVTAIMPDMTQPFVTAPGALRHPHPVAAA